MVAFKRSPGCCSCGPTPTPTPAGGGRACVIVQDGCNSQAPPLRGATVTIWEQAVGSATIADGGQGYTSVPDVIIDSPPVTIAGQHGRQATAHAVVSGGSLVDLIIDDGGNGYFQGTPAIGIVGGTAPTQQAVIRVDLDNAATNGPYASTPNVTFSGGDGSGAQAVAVMSGGGGGGGAIDPTITVTAGGHGYTAPPAVSFGGGGTGAAATARMGLAAYTIVDPGFGGMPGDYYLFWFDDGGGTGGGMYTIGGDGKLAAITIDPPGSGFQRPPTADFSDSGLGGTPQVNFTLAVVAVTLSTGGSGYVNPTVIFTGGGGSGAAATATTAAGALRVDSIQMTAGGTYDVVPPTVTIDPPGGSGVQATGTAVLGPQSGGGGATGAIVTANVVTRPVNGSATTHPMVVQVDVANATTNGPYTSIPNVTFGGGDGSGAQARAIMSGGTINPTIPVQAGGHDFTAPPSVSFGGGGSGAAATAHMGLDAYTIVDPGLGGAPGDYNIEWMDSGGGTGGGTYTIGADGTLSAITINPPGTDFQYSPVIDFYASNLGGNPRVDFTFKVVAVTLVVGGSGYVGPTVIFTGGGGAGAAATATASAARVGSIRVTDGGSYDVTPPTVTIDPPAGGGTTATATATLGTQACIGGLPDGFYLAQAVAGGLTPSDPTLMTDAIQDGRDGMGTVILANYYAWVGDGVNYIMLPGATVVLSQPGQTIGTFTSDVNGAIGPIVLPTPYRPGTYTAVISAPNHGTQTFTGSNLISCTIPSSSATPATWVMT